MYADEEMELERGWSRVVIDVLEEYKKDLERSKKEKPQAEL